MAELDDHFDPQRRSLGSPSLQARSMSPRAYARAIEALGLNQAQAARWLGVSERTGRRYVAGEAAVPPSQVMLLAMAQRLGVTPAIPQRKPRHY